MAPETGQRASLEKHRCPDSRAIMDGKSLDIENVARITHTINVRHLPAKINEQFDSILW